MSSFRRLEAGDASSHIGEVQKMVCYHPQKNNYSPNVFGKRVLGERGF